MPTDLERRMCVRRDCPLVAKPTYELRCTLCMGYTEPWGKTRSALLAGLPGTDVLIVTTNDIPGYRIVDVHGDVFGLVVRARNVFSNMGAQLRSLVGGEVGGYTALLMTSRDEARERLREAVRERGGNAVVAMRFDCNEIGDIMSEIAAYGTAVTVVREDHRPYEQPKPASEEAAHRQVAHSH